MSYKPYIRGSNGELVELPLSVENSKVSQKLGTENIGTTKEPIYLKDGIPQKCSDLSARIVDLIYPIGSIYLSVNSTNPQTLFGGTWEQLKDKFLLGAGNSYSCGNVGGEATHKLTIEEMPSHTHTQNQHTHIQNSHMHKFNRANQNEWSGNVVSGANGKARYLGWVEQASGGGDNYQYTSALGHRVADSETATNNYTTATNNETGGNVAHNNMPPYLVVSMWKRIA